MNVLFLLNTDQFRPLLAQRQPAAGVARMRSRDSTPPPSPVQKSSFRFVSGETSPAPEGSSLAGSLDGCGEIILSGSGVIISIIVTV